MTNISTESGVHTGSEAGHAPVSEGSPVLEAAALAEETIALVRRWLTEAAKVPVDASAEQLAGVLKDPNGLDFTVGFVDGVDPPRGPAGRRPQPRRAAPRTSRRSCPGTCAAPSASAASLAPVAAAAWSSRSPAACCAKWSATSSSTPRDAKLGPAIAQIRERRRRASTSTSSARPCSASRRPPAASRAPTGCSPATTSTTSRSRSPRPSRRTRRGPSTRPSSTSSRRSPRSSRCAASVAARRSSSTSTWRSTATST